MTAARIIWQWRIKSDIMGTYFRRGDAVFLKRLAVTTQVLRAPAKYYFFFASFFFIRALTNFLMSATGSFLSRGKRIVAPEAS
jgi:hypothetical protein